MDGDSLVLTVDQAERFAMRWAIDGDVLTFERDESLGIAPTPFVLRPWTRQEEATDGDAATSPILGTWTRVTSCEAFIEALEDAGLEDHIDEWVVNFWHDDPDAVPSPDPCAGEPNEVAFSHFFLADGQRGALDETGEQVDDGTYTLIDDHTLSLQDFRVTFVIEGDTMHFTAVIPPEPCDEDCRDTFAYLISAYYPGEFTRTG